MVNISLDGGFLAVIATPNPCPINPCKLLPMDGMLLIGKSFDNERCHLNMLQVT